MAYRRPRYARKRPASKKKYGGTRLRYRKKRPAYRKKAAMSKKRILDVTTVKKRDNMLPYTNLTNASQGGTTYLAAPAVINGQTSSDPNVNSPVCLLWCATARDLDDTAGNINVRVNETARTSVTPYMVGLREKVEIQLSSGLPWQWRRICFTYKGPLGGADSSSSFQPYTESTAGYRRTVNSVQGDRNAGQQYSLYEILFAGQNASDWLDPMIAKTDQTRVTVKYDRTRTIASGNDRGMVRKFNMYHPMGATLAYNDDERGGNMASSPYSVESKVGMGDYWVVDLIRSRFGAATTDQMIFSPSATLYWHEK